MSTHYIPKNLKGETRILIIFTTKSLITTAIGLAIGGAFFAVFGSIGLKIIGIILLALMGLIGYGVGTLKIPKITGWRFTNNIEGDSLDEVIVRYAKFKTNRKVYSYTKEER